MPNPFDNAWTDFHTAGQSVMGETVTIDDKQIDAIVTPIDSSDNRIPGVHTFDNSASVFINPEDFNDLGKSRGLDGKVVVVRGERMRVAQVINGGASGAELICSKVEQRNNIPRL
jgi:hypothetical protein